MIRFLLVLAISSSVKKGLSCDSSEASSACEALQEIQIIVARSDEDLSDLYEDVVELRKNICEHKSYEMNKNYLLQERLEDFFKKCELDVDVSFSSLMKDFILDNFISNLLPIFVGIVMFLMRNRKLRLLMMLVVVSGVIAVSSLRRSSCNSGDYQRIRTLYTEHVSGIGNQSQLVSTDSLQHKIHLDTRDNHQHQQQVIEVTRDSWLMQQFYSFLMFCVKHSYVKVDN